MRRSPCSLRRRDGGTVRRRDGFLGCSSVSLSLCLSVSLSLHLSISPSPHLSLALERISFNTHRRPVNALSADNDHVAGLVEGQSDERRTGEHDFSVAPVGFDADDAAASSQ